MIYLDHNATTPLDERVLEAMMPYLNSHFGNPSSLYRIGRASRSAIETAREQVATLLNTQPSQVIFTSGGTEANNIALHSLSIRTIEGTIGIGSTEHASVQAPAKILQQKGKAVLTVNVDTDGYADLQQLQALLTQQTLSGLSLMWANNETGVIQNINALSDLIKPYDTLWHCDATQAAGKIPIHFDQTGIDLLSISAHKLYGPKGIGALAINHSVEVNPLHYGGGQEKGLRGGTENVAAIVGFGKAAQLANEELEQRQQHVLQLRDQLEMGLKQLPATTIFAHDSERLSNTCQFGIQGTDGEMLLMQLDRKNIAVSSGSACNSQQHDASPVLTAMGVDPTLARSAIRISLGTSNTAADIDQLLGELKHLLPNPR